MYNVFNIREDCQMRHENGNCLPIGGFCTAVSDILCEALHQAYDKGYVSGRKAVSCCSSCSFGDDKNADVES